MQVFKILKCQSLSYLVDLISRHEPTCALRSRDTNFLASPGCSSKFGDRRFSVSGPRVWNDLPTHIKNVEFLTQFKALLKTYFFTQVLLKLRCTEIFCDGQYQYFDTHFTVYHYLLSL